jgi:hypothetical protein
MTRVGRPAVAGRGRARGACDGRGPEGTRSCAMSKGQLEIIALGTGIVRLFKPEYTADL